MFSFGVQELARAANRDAGEHRAAVNSTQPKTPKPALGGFDPYNSTGGFDRKNAWNRIRKR
jgi:hypothetical protein